MLTARMVDTKKCVQCTPGLDVFNRGETRRRQQEGAMTGTYTRLSAAQAVGSNAQGQKSALVFCLAFALLGFFATPHWCGAAEVGSPEIVQKRLSSVPEKLLVQWQTAKKATLRALIDVPARPKAAVILFAGDNGCLGLTESGEQTSLQGNFLARSRALFVREGLIAVLVDVPADVSGQSANSYRTSADQAQDAAMVMDFVRKQWHVPVALVGTSRGTISAANTAARLERGNADALVLTSTVTQSNKKGSGTIYDAALGRIAIPVLIFHNEQDACKVSPYSGVQGLQRALKNAPRKDIISLSHGGAIADACQGLSAHGYLGVEGQAVSSIASWISSCVLPTAK